MSITRTFYVCFLCVICHVFRVDTYSELFKVDTTDASLTLSWTGDPKLESTLTEWEVKIGNRSVETLASSRFNQNGRVVLTNGLGAGESYSLSVVFVTGADGAYPERKEQIVLDKDVRLNPKPVRDLLRSEPGGPTDNNLAGTVQLTWAAGPNSVQDTFKVRHRSLFSTSTGWSDYSYTPLTRMYLTELVPGDRYQFEVAAVSGNKPSLPVLIEESIHPGKVEQIWSVKSPSSTTSVTIYVDGPVGIIRSWFLQYKLIACDCYWIELSDFPMQITEGREYRGTLHNLEPGNTYIIRIAVQGIHGTKNEDTNRGNFVELIYTTVPMINSSLNLVQPPSDTSVELEYTPTEASFDYYLVELSENRRPCTNDDCPHLTKEPNDNNRIVAFYNLKPGTHYEANLFTIAGDKSSRTIKLDFKTTGTHEESNDMDNRENLLPVVIILAIFSCILLFVIIGYILLKRYRRNSIGKSNSKNGHLDRQQQTLPFFQTRSVLPVPPLPRSDPSPVPRPPPNCPRSTSTDNEYLEIVSDPNYDSSPSGYLEPQTSDTNHNYSESGYLEPLNTAARDSGDYDKPYEQLKKAGDESSRV